MAMTQLTGPSAGRPPAVIGGLPVELRDDAPRREIVIGGAVAALFFVLFLGWAAVAPMDVGAHATGVVSVSGNRQAVQHRDGGVVSALLVHDGDVVKQGQVLLEINANELRANERSLTGTVISQQAARARLQAERDGQNTITPPPEWANLSPEDRALADQTMKLETEQLKARRTSLSSQQGVLNQRVAQLNQQISGYKQQLTANAEQQRLLHDQLTGTKTLAAKGYAPMTEVRALERSLADLQGTKGSYEAEVARTGDAISEARMQLDSNEKQRQEQVVEQLRQTEMTLSEQTPKMYAAREQLARAMVRAPVAGTVVGQTAFTVGGVVAPGQKLMEIVPTHASLVIDATISPNDADDLHVGQKAEVRFPSFHERSMPILTGTLTKLSADAFTDEKTGAHYYKGEVTVPPNEIAVINRVRGAEHGLKPGLPAEVVVKLRKRTALQYFFEPLTSMMWRSFHER